MKQRTGEERAIVCGHPKRELGFSDGIDWKLTYPLVCLFIYYLLIYYFIYCLISHKSNSLFEKLSCLIALHCIVLYCIAC